MRTLGERKQLDAHVTKSAALRGFAPRSRWRVTRLRAARDIEWIKKGGQGAASANARAREIYGHRGNNTDTQLDVTVAGSSGAIVVRSHAPGRRVGDPHFSSQLARQTHLQASSRHAGIAQLPSTHLTQWSAAGAGQSDDTWQVLPADGVHVSWHRPMLPQT